MKWGIRVGLIQGGGDGEGVHDCDCGGRWGGGGEDDGGTGVGGGGVGGFGALSGLVGGMLEMGRECGFRCEVEGLTVLPMWMRCRGTQSILFCSLDF